jgi:hypothetical protein
MGRGVLYSKNDAGREIPIRWTGLRRAIPTISCWIARLYHSTFDPAESILPRPTRVANARCEKR